MARRKAQGVGDTAQGVGEAQDDGVTDDVATFIDSSFSVIESAGEYNGAFSANDSDGTDVVNDYYDEFALDYVGDYVLDLDYRQVDSYTWPARRWPPGQRVPGSWPA